MSNFLVIDCESIGLYGDSFAIGYVLVNRDGATLLEGVLQTKPDFVQGLESNHIWVKNNVNLVFPDYVNVYTCSSIDALKNEFWKLWKQHRESAYLAADCLFPVEAKFLLECVRQSEVARQWEAPYPFIEISTLLLACGKNPTEKFTRLDSELPEHNPLTDARQSARIMIKCFNQLNIFNNGK